MTAKRVRKIEGSRFAAQNAKANRTVTADQV
jgi:hypothetical protein